jgi:hypothetical protein
MPGPPIRASYSMSDFGSKMGATSLAQVRSSEAVSPGSSRLTSPNAAHQIACSIARSVVVLDVVRSNPIARDHRSSNCV